MGRFFYVLLYQRQADVHYASLALLIVVIGTKYAVSSSPYGLQLQFESILAFEDSEYSTFVDLLHVLKEVPRA